MIYPVFLHPGNSNTLTGMIDLKSQMCSLTTALDIAMCKEITAMMSTDSWELGFLPQVSIVYHKERLMRY